MKIPLPIWTIIIITGIILLVNNYNSVLDIDRIDTISKIITVIGVYYVALQINKQSKDSIISTEYLNQPNFEFVGVFKSTFEDSSPGYCTLPTDLNYNQCNDLHWFDFKHIGNLPAQNVKLTLIHKSEANNIHKLIDERSMDFEMVYPNNKHQFKISPLSVPISLFDTQKNGEFYILLDYISIYSKIRYKRVYLFDYAPKVTPNSNVTDWKDAIRYFALSLNKLQDSRNIGFKYFLKNILHNFLFTIGIKKTQSINDWLINI